MPAVSRRKCCPTAVEPVKATSVQGDGGVTNERELRVGVLEVMYVERINNNLVDARVGA